MSSLLPLTTAALAVLSFTGCGVFGGGPPVDDSGFNTSEVGHRWKAVSAGFDACGITIEGEVLCWGHSPALVTGAPVGFDYVAVSVGEGGACALDSLGLPVCWGAMSDEQPPPLEPLLSVAVTKTYACGVRISDGSIVCWGEQRGPGGDPTRPDLIPEGDFIQVTLHEAMACALRRGGELACWNHEFYELNDYGGLDWQTPSIPTRSGFVQHDINGDNNPIGCAVDDVGEVECWGWGGGVTPRPPSPARAVSVWNTRPPCSLGTDGFITCWGGTGDQPTDIAFTQFDLGTSFGCGVTVDATMLCWGSETFGTLTPPS